MYPFCLTEYTDCSVVAHFQHHLYLALLKMAIVLMKKREVSNLSGMPKLVSLLLCWHWWCLCLQYKVLVKKLNAIGRKGITTDANIDTLKDSIKLHSK